MSEPKAHPRGLNRRGAIIGAVAGVACVVAGVVTVFVVHGSKDDAGGETVAEMTESISGVDEAAGAVQVAEQARLDSLRRDSIANAQAKNTLYESYKKILRSHPNDTYLMTDIDGDGIKEMWLESCEGPRAEWGTSLYVKGSDGKAKRVDSAVYGGIYDCGNYVLISFAEQGCYNIWKYNLSKGKLSHEEVYINDVDGYGVIGEVKKGDYADKVFVDNNYQNCKPSHERRASDLSHLRKSFGMDRL